MILLLGASSYVGQAFARALRGRRECFIPLSRQAFDYARFEFLFDYVRNMRPDFLINAAEYPFSVKGASHEIDRLQMLQTNTVLPQTVGRVCSMTRTPWAHLSSGSIYAGAKVSENGLIRVEEHLHSASLQRLFESNPESLLGFHEEDPPNSCFRSSPCAFYSGTKALAEESVRSLGHAYIWRFHLPFNEIDDSESYLTQLAAKGTLRPGINSLSHVDDCASACLELWARRAPFGIYNVVNPGAIGVRQVQERLFRNAGRSEQRSASISISNPHRSGDSKDEVLSDCLLDSSKLSRTGIRLRPVSEAIDHALRNWQPQFRGLHAPIPRPADQELRLSAQPR